MRARRVIGEEVADGLLSFVAGVAAAVLAIAGPDPEFGAFEIGLAIFMGFAIVLFVVLAGRTFRRMEPAPDALTVASPLSIVVRDVLPGATSPALVVFLAVIADGGIWILGVGCALLGVVRWGIAAHAARVERRTDGRVFRIETGLFLAH